MAAGHDLSPGTTTAEAGGEGEDSSRVPHPDIDLVRIAAHLRRVMPRVDEEARERLEKAWVSLINAVKQPKTDAARLAHRFGRLREELDALMSRGETAEAPGLRTGDDTTGRPSGPERASRPLG
jgi:hypothetical protein